MVSRTMLAVFVAFASLTSFTDAMHTFTSDKDKTTTSVIVDYKEIINVTNTYVKIGESLVYFVGTGYDDILLKPDTGNNITLAALSMKMYSNNDRSLFGFKVSGGFTIINNNPTRTRAPFYVYAVATSNTAALVLPTGKIDTDFLPEVVTFLSDQESIGFDHFYLASADSVTVYPCGYDAINQKNILPVLKSTTTLGAYRSKVNVLSPIATVVFKNLKQPTAAVGDIFANDANAQRGSLTPGASTAAMSWGYSGYNQNYPNGYGLVNGAGSNVSTGLFTSTSVDDNRNVKDVYVSLQITHSNKNTNDLLRIVSMTQDGITESLYKGEVSGSDGAVSFWANSLAIHWDTDNQDAYYLVRIDTTENSAVAGGLSMAVAALLLWFRL